MFKNILFALSGAVLMLAVIFGIHYFLAKPELALTYPNSTGECGVEGCTDSNIYFGNDVGNVIPDYNLTDFEGNTVSLYDLIEDGDYDKVVVALEADWCSDCHRQDDKLTKDGAIPENVLFIPVFTSYSKEGDPERQANYDTAKAYAVDKYDAVGITSYFDTDKILWEDFNGTGTPTNIVLNHEGRIKAKTLEVDADILFLDNEEAE